MNEPPRYWISRKKGSTGWTNGGELDYPYILLSMFSKDKGSDLSHN